MLAAAPLPRRDDLDPPKDQPHGCDVDAFNAQHPSMLMWHIVLHHDRPPCSTPPRATSVSASLKGADKKNPPLRLEDQTVFSALLRKPMNWLGVCRDNAASSIGLSGRPVWFSATMPVRNPSLAAARSNSRVRTATCSYLNCMV